MLGKKENLQLDIVDLIIAALTDICSATIIAYYSTNTDLQSHIFQPPNETSKICLELSFANGHYDLVVDQIDNTRNIVSAFPDTKHVEVLITDCPCKNTVMEHNVKQEIIKKEPVRLTFLEKYICFQRQKTEGAKIIGVNQLIVYKTNTSMTEFVSGKESPNMSDFDLSEHHPHDESPIKFKEPRIYRNNQVFENVSVQYVENFPVDIDGTVMYVVPENSNGELKACKGGRSWCKAQSSKIKEYTKCPRLLLNCRGSHICKNKNCKNIGDFGIN